MINFKPEIVKVLKHVHSNVVESYPNDWANLPVIIYEEEENVPYWIQTSGENLTSLRYRIEIYSNSSTSELKTRINEELTKLGFTRSFATDTNDLGDRRHTTLRYEGVYNKQNNKIYKK